MFSSAQFIHGYGVIVGVAGVVVWELLHRLSLRWPVPERLAKHWGWVFLAALMGARLWHIWTDWSWYQPLLQQGQWWQLVAVWQGGLSVLGAIAAALLTICWLSDGGEKRKWWVGTDVLFLALPWGQVIGRWANWWNQELYGLPTTLPWGIWIDPVHRLVSVMEFSHFHPLFAYEAIGVGLLGGWLWRQQSRRGWEPGAGRLTLAYLALYSWLRLGLDFLRVDRPVVWLGLSQNQWCLVLVGGLSTVILVKQIFRSAKLAFLTSLAGLAMMILGFLVSHAIWQDHQFTRDLQHLSDGSQVTLMIQSQSQQIPLQLALAKTSQSRAVGLGGRPTLPGDGMIFVFDNADRWLFWMKDMQFDLDFIWIYQGKIMGVAEKVAAPATASQPLTVFALPVPVDVVVELAAGKVKQLGIQAGDTLKVSGSD